MTLPLVSALKKPKPIEESRRVAAWLHALSAQMQVYGECPRGARGVDGRGVARDETGAGRGREKTDAARRRRSVSYY